jgi:biotin carboxyl carrier protein
MASRTLTSEPANPLPAIPEHSAVAATSPRHRMSTRNRLLFFVTAWAIVLMPFLFWWSTWFGRRLSDTQITEYLNDDKHPRHIQHALVQLGERMARQDPRATRWYPQLSRLASHSVEEVRNTDAWVMGQDTSAAVLHEVLLKMLQDSSPMVRGNAALSLVRFGDATGRAQIVALLQPATVVAPAAGRVIDIDKIGTSVRQGGLIAKLQDESHTTEIRAPITGRIRTLSIAIGATVVAGAEVAAIDPSSEQVWEALRALYLVGQPDDLAAIRIYERNVPEIPDRLRQQAVLTEKAIRERATHQP